MKIFALLAPAVLCITLAACDDSATSVVCPGDAGPSVVVSVLDAQTGQSVTAQASGTWTVGTVSDSLRHYPEAGGGMVLAAFGPPGTYEVRVVRPGHEDWIASGIQVSAGQCGPARANVTATLTAVHQAITF
jgi:hypothetical protein